MAEEARRKLDRIHMHSCIRTIRRLDWTLPIPQGLFFLNSGVYSASETKLEWVVAWARIEQHLLDLQQIEACNRKNRVSFGLHKHWALHTNVTIVFLSSSLVRSFAAEILWLTLGLKSDTIHQSSISIAVSVAWFDSKPLSSQTHRMRSLRPPSEQPSSLSPVCLPNFQTHAISRSQPIFHLRNTIGFQSIRSLLDQLAQHQSHSTSGHEFYQMQWALVQGHHLLPRLRVRCPRELVSLYSCRCRAQHSLPALCREICLELPSPKRILLQNICPFSTRFHRTNSHSDLDR